MGGLVAAQGVAVRAAVSCSPAAASSSTPAVAAARRPALRVAQQWTGLRVAATPPARTQLAGCMQSMRNATRRTTTVASAGNGTATGPSGLAIDLTGKRAFIAGVADDQGFGWAIAKALNAAGAEVLLGTWVPALNIFETSLRRGKFDESRQLPNGGMLEIAKVYPLDAVFDNPEDVPEEIATNKRYAGYPGYTVQECADKVKADYGSIDILVHSLANGPEVAKPLLETSRKGYLAAASASSYSYVSLLQRFGPLMRPGGSALSLTYGGGMSSAKAALESDTRVLAWEAGRKWGLRVNTISAGPLRSRAAKAIGFIDDMINYAEANSPLTTPLESDNVGSVAAFLASPLASAITGVTLYVDNGLHAMGLAVNSPSLSVPAPPPSPAPEPVAK
eukprot:jgi/Chlat1/4169/Chrsp27S04270